MAHWSWVNIEIRWIYLIVYASYSGLLNFYELASARLPYYKKLHIADVSLYKSIVETHLIAQTHINT